MRYKYQALLMDDAEPLMEVYLKTEAANGRYESLFEDQINLLYAMCIVRD